MEIFTDGDFWTIVAVVVSALGVYRAEKADRRRERQEMEKRMEAGEKRLAEQIGSLRQETKDALAIQRQELTDAISAQKQETSAAMASQKQEIGRRIDRLEDRFDKNHREVTAGLAELKASVSALSAKLDERSRPRGLEGVGLSSAGADVTAGVVREMPAPYSADKPEGEADGTPGSRPSHPREESPD